MLPYEIMVTQGRSDEYDDKLHDGKLRAVPKTRENSAASEIKKDEKCLRTGDKLPKYDVTILVALPTPSCAPCLTCACRSLRRGCCVLGAADAGGAPARTSWARLSKRM